MPDLGQQRAAYAWKVVQGCSRDYANLAKAAPALVMGNGLMQTLAFYRSKEKEHEQLANHICEWLAMRFAWHDRFPKGHDRRQPSEDQLFKDIMTALANASPSLYRSATEETMALLKWIRQFSSAVAG